MTTASGAHGARDLPRRLSARLTARAAARLGADRRRVLPGVRLIRAEFLKLTRRRGLMITAAALSAGAVIASYLWRTVSRDA